MPVNVTKDSFDLGVVIRDADASLAFYRDLLGLEEEGVLPMPGMGTMHRLRCGTAVLKLIVPEKDPGVGSPPGGPTSGYGLRYWTITVDNLDAMAAEAEQAGYSVPVPPLDLRPGVRIAMLQDPDGNWVELLEPT